MSEPALPEDLSLWPTGPYELLGVEPGIAPKELKRTYTRLIRRFNPESHPEHFRRIREAYESVLRLIEFHERYGITFTAAEPEAPPETREPQTDSEGDRDETVSASPSPPERPEPAEPFVVVESERASTEPAPAAAPEEEAASARANEFNEPESAETERTHSRIEKPPAARAPIDEAHEFWERAIRGEELEAYAGLRRLHEAAPQRSELCLRLYWLLALNPEVDPGRQPCDWLVLVLRNAGWRGPALELYRREVEADPQETRTPRFEELLNAVADQNALVELYTWRWSAVRNRQDWSVLADDWPIAKRRLFGAEELHWLRFLCAAADTAAWIEPDDPDIRVWDDVKEEIKHLPATAAQHGQWFDQLDFLMAVRADWHKAKRRTGASAPLLELIQMAWRSTWPAYRPSYDRVINGIVEDPDHWLPLLDEVMGYAPALIGSFGQILRERENAAGLSSARPSSELIAYLTGVFLNGLPARWSSNFRTLVVDYCRREALDPLWMVEAVFENRVDWAGELDPQVIARLAEDWPVRYVCLAYRLFWH